MMAGWLIALIVLATIVGGVLVTLVIVTIVRDETERQAEAPKAKRTADPGFDSWSLRPADGELGWAEEHGDLLELSEDDLYVDEKPKRHADDE